MINATLASSSTCPGKWPRHAPSVAIAESSVLRSCCRLSAWRRKSSIADGSAKRKRSNSSVGKRRSKRRTLWLLTAPRKMPQVAPREWQVARALTLPELTGFHEVDHPYEYDVQFSQAWAAPTQGGAFAVIYKVSATVHDRYGSDMFPMHAIRWVLRPVAVDGSTCTGWKGDPTVLFRTGSKHALPPLLARMA